MNILFVDDEQPILDMVTNYFTGKNHTVFTAHDGVEALSVLKNEKMDCCFTDLDMPKMGGMELAKNIQKIDSAIPIIVMTGYPSLDATISTLKSGVVDFLVKPIGLRQMEIAMRTVMHRREIFVENAMLKKELESKAKIEKIHGQLKKKADDLSILNEIIETMESAKSTKDVFEKAVSLALKITGAQTSFFFAMGEELQAPVCVCHSADSVQFKGEFNKTVSPQIREQLALWVRKINFNSLPALLPQKNNPGVLPENILSMAAVPIALHEKPFGVLLAANISKHAKINKSHLKHLLFATEKTGLAIENFGLYENIYDNLLSTLYAFVKTLEARDAYTRRHSMRVTKISELMAQQLGVNLVDMEILHVAGTLHDIGKIGIPDSILLKPGKLTDEEFGIIKRHPDIGANIVEYMGLWDTEKEIIRHHHEKFDGTGYPQGLAKEDIPFLSRILAVADVYDAVTTNRAYRKRLPEAVCKKIIKEGSGIHFDPMIVEAFFILYEQNKIPEPTKEDIPQDEVQAPE